MLDKVITYSFYLLFFLTPLFWTSFNFELFEYNKMILAYTITVVIVGAWILKSINEKRLTIKRTPLDIPLLLFLGANILSTIFSIDVHTSVWGYYSRSNGGLLSIISYLLLFWAFVSNMDKEKVLITLKFGLVSGFLISIWAIMEHFGVSPSCIILRGEINASCWVQDVQARVFATLGQPNWLAAYLAMLIFPAIYFYLTVTRFHSLYYTLLLTLYLAFTFTYSRGPTLGLIGGFFVYLFSIKFKLTKPLILVLASFLAINILFGSAVTNFRLVSLFAAPIRQPIALPTSGTQLENGGTESGAIRLIVWQGALDIFKAYPIFGSGLETFAYSYYQFRPTSHNLTSEWDFLYNKAHNEYLNYLATTGLVGFGTYIFLIGSFLVWSIKYSVYRENKSLHTPYSILHTAILASYVSYLIYNFFLFSVVIIAIFFFLFPAIAFISTESTKPFNWPKKLYSIPNTIYSILYRRPLYTNSAKTIISLISLYFLYSIFNIWQADVLFSRGDKASDSGNPGRAYNLLTEAVDLNPGEPFYRSELGYSAAAAAAALESSDATLSAALKEEALAQTEFVLERSPKNVSFWRTAIRTYYELVTLDPKYVDQTLKAIDTTISLAPTDPKLYYNKALILDSIGKKDEEIKLLQKALQLKPNYLEALAQIKEATASGK